MERRNVIELKFKFLFKTDTVDKIHFVVFTKKRCAENGI